LNDFKGSRGGKFPLFVEAGANPLRLKLAPGLADLRRLGGIMRARKAAIFTLLCGESQHYSLQKL
jgi:hypothetical protein